MALSMKKISWLMFVVLCSPVVAAYAGDRMVGDLQPIYCPAQINCTKTGCDFDAKAAKYFSLPSNATKCVDANKFKYAVAPFHSTSTAGSCWYEGQHIGTCGGIMLTIKPEANLEAYYQPNLSAWDFSGQGAKCTAETASSCPLKERLGFVIHNMNITGGLFASSNTIKITNLIPSGGYVAVTDEDVLLGCGNVPQCTIDIISDKSFKYGSLTIDVSAMKILKINLLGPSKVQINKIEPFNSVEISYPSLTK